MTNMVAWLAALATMAILVAYEGALAFGHRRRPGQLARTAHAALREEWFEAVSAQKGSEILAVQTLRNSLMSATMTASTAVLGLMGTVTLAAPLLRATLGDVPAMPGFTAHLALELALMVLLFASLASSVMAVRYYNHAGFIAAMPVDTDARRSWSDAGKLYVRRAGILYSWGLRHLILVAPILASMVHPAAGPVAALGVVAVLLSFDSFQNNEGRAAGALRHEPPHPK
ncbi:MAG: DUF599 domain-containing protein [Variovorax sp.]|nr:DUF599 domain-containing protein [Variovorax sp.]